MQKTKDIQQRLQVVLAAGRLQFDHRVGRKQAISLKGFNPFLGLVLAVLMKDLVDEGKVYQWILFCFFVEANVLKFQVAMGVTQLVNYFKLRYDLHTDVREVSRRKRLVLVVVVQRLLDVEHLEYVLAHVAHHDLANPIA